MKQQGVTFLELVICLGILSIIGSSSLFSLGQSLRKQELESASLLLAADLRWLQQLSINERSIATAYLLVFKQTRPYGYDITANTQTVKTVLFPRSVTLHVPYPRISFGRSGAPLLGAQTISLESGKLHSWKYVILAPVTGRIRLSETSPHQGED